MRAVWLVAVGFGVVLTSGAAPAARNPLSAERGRTRPLVLVAPSPDDRSAVALSHALGQPALRAEFADRQIIVFTVLAGRGEREGRPLGDAETAALLAALGASADGPATTSLVGKDGGIKLRGADLTVQRVLAAIDQMPMRRLEVQRRE